MRWALGTEPCRLPGVLPGAALAGSKFWASVPAQNWVPWLKITQLCFLCFPAWKGHKRFLVPSEPGLGSTNIRGHGTSEPKALGLHGACSGGPPFLPRSWNEPAEVFLSSYLPCKRKLGRGKNENKSVAQESLALCTRDDPRRKCLPICYWRSVEKKLQKE